jgi:hypothetical protein
MTLAAVDFSADRIWAWSGAPGQTPQIVPLESADPELPLAVAVAGRELRAGRWAWQRTRCLPHQVCRHFLPRLGQSCLWDLGRYRLTPEAALRTVLLRMRPHLVGSRGVVLSVPGYLHREQVSLLARLGVETGLPILGALPRAAAVALAANPSGIAPSVGVVVDVDDHALLCCAVEWTANEVLIRPPWVLTGLGLRVWREQVIRCVAEECIRLCRRDPRESPEADQSVFDQIDDVLEQCSQSRSAVVRVQAVAWYQEVTVRPEAVAGGCGILGRQAADAIWRYVLRATTRHEEPAVWLTAEAARLPGLAAAFYARSREQVPISMIALSDVGRAIHALAGRIDSGELAPGYLETAVPLPSSRGDQKKEPIGLSFLPRFSVSEAT